MALQPLTPPLARDALVDGAPVTLEEPIAITPREWAALDCVLGGPAPPDHLHRLIPRAPHLVARVMPVGASSR